MTASDAKPPHRPTWMQRVPLRSLLVVPFVVQLAAAVGLTNALSLRNGERAVTELTSVLRQEITGSIQERVRAYLDEPHAINQANANAVQLNQIDPTRVATMERHFWLQSQTFTDASFIYFGNEQGDSVGIERLEDGTLQVGFGDRSTNGGYVTYSVDESGDRDELIKRAPEYDPRQRPWYRSAVTAGEPIWTEIYPFFSRETLGIGAARPLYDADGALLGVMAVDVTLARLN
ncbi:MAG: cache domain-containing protein, partial [Cyanobacteria bacterium J06639_1]